jgi:hypothetical protein
MSEVLQHALGKFLNSVGEATFWILIIVSVGMIAERIYKRIVSFMIEDVKPKEEQPKEEE